MIKILEYLGMCTALILMMSIYACKSNTNTKTDVQEYQSITLDFTISYPSRWDIFEASDSVMLSNDVNNFIKPHDERLQQRGDFLAKIYIIENEEMIDFITSISHLQSTNTVYRMDDLKNLFDYILEEAKPRISQQYQELFLRAPSYQIEFLSIDNGIIIGDMKGDERGIKVLYVLKLMEKNTIIFEEISFNEILPNNDITDFVNVANSLKIDYNGSI